MICGQFPYPYQCSPSPSLCFTCLSVCLTVCLHSSAICLSFFIWYIYIFIYCVCGFAFFYFPFSAVQIHWMNATKSLLTLSRHIHYTWNCVAKSVVRKNQIQNITKRLQFCPMKWVVWSFNQIKHFAFYFKCVNSMSAQNIQFDLIMLFKINLLIRFKLGYWHCISSATHKYFLVVVQVINRLFQRSKFE